jgi:hypothetical protein
MPKLTIREIVVLKENGFMNSSSARAVRMIQGVRLGLWLPNA